MKLLYYKRFWELYKYMYLNKLIKNYPKNKHGYVFELNRKKKLLKRLPY